MKILYFALPGNENLAANILNLTDGDLADFTLRQFPDSETYLRILSEVENKVCVVVCSLNQPNNKIIPLYYLLKLLREMKAAKIILVAPYLSYMRQDTKFNPGEAVTSEYFAQLLSQWADELVTIDPHLHRKHSMGELYTIPCKVLHAAPLIAAWIKTNIKKPVLVGPDVESMQWVSEAAKEINSPYIILKKNRLGDRNVEISIPNVEKYKDCTPVIIDDIISTAHTVIETVKNINLTGMKAPVVVGVHAVFAGNAFEDLKQAGAGEIITCNTIMHQSNKIDISGLVASELNI